MFIKTKRYFPNIALLADLILKDIFYYKLLIPNY